MADTQWLTQAQYDALKAELDERVQKRRPHITHLIDEARQEGDLRENGGYHAARNEQSLNESRIASLQEMLANAEVGETPADDGIVEPGMVVTATIAGREQTFLLGSRDAGGDLGVQVFSAKAPLGAAVIGHKAGDTLTYQAPNGREIEVVILSCKPFTG
ncbi:MAG: transcription elongation factor GreA [Actinomyces sp.]|jgi:transcription elongation factor GreA|nr:transcription elongation factor GreA [Actinomyces sp.]MCI1641704.1 transcription elongation factor GreA [Actinomyces sp.]MCI1661823.1 transcription elongation factor GreA [Actinomyces sp.]MCI1690665.1 transcription elongation factor GreA [Actinomyces sp.]MCI1786735.1 transcription elongation factor GreA [Actinomyces sp.]MCI1829123.1 transcription elongation factor GreA [Actinomyces sp.]